MNTTFDTINQLEGDIKVAVKDQDDTPNQALPIDALWKLEVEWHLLHSLTNSNSPAGVGGGTWFLTVSLESIGKGYEGPVQITGGPDPTVLEVGYADAVYLISSAHDDYGWKAIIDITQAEMTRLTGLVAPDEPLIPNNYRVSVVITFKNTLNIIVPMVATDETNLVAFYVPA